MRLDTAEARARLAAHFHGVLCTIHPERGPDPQPVVYALSGDGADDYVGVPIDRVKPKAATTRLGREENLDSDPRSALLIENWDADDWTRLWWVRAHLRYVPDPLPRWTEDLAARLARAVPQYADRPFHRIIVCRMVAVTGWAAAPLS